MILANNVWIVNAIFFENLRHDLAKISNLTKIIIITNIFVYFPSAFQGNDTKNVFGFLTS